LTQNCRKFPSFCPRPHCTLANTALYTYCIKLYFEFDCLDFFTNFCSPNRKIVPVPRDRGRTDDESV